MPSPIGHALAGFAISMAVPAGPPHSPAVQPNWKLAGLCALAGALPDIDLLYMPVHRTITHSIPVGILFLIIAMGVTGQVNSKKQKSTTAGEHDSSVYLAGLLVGLSWLSHALMDWMGADANPPYGVQMWWPFSDRWFFSAWNIFPGTERRDPLGARAILINAKAAALEVLIMGPIALGACGVRRHFRGKNR